MSTINFDFSNEEHYMETARYNFYNSPEFKEMCEQLGVNIEIVDGRMILTGSQSSLEQIEAAYEEFKRDYAQPGDSRTYRQEMVREELSELEKGSLDAILNEKYETTKSEISKRNAIKTLNKFNLNKEVDEKEKELEEIDEELEAMRERIRTKQRQLLEKLKREENIIKDKASLILDKVISDPDEIAGVQEMIDRLNKEVNNIRGKMPHINDFVEDLDREVQDLEDKIERRAQIALEREKLKEIQRQKEKMEKEEEARIQEEKEAEEDEIDNPFYIRPY